MMRDIQRKLPIKSPRFDQSHSTKWLEACSYQSLSCLNNTDVISAKVSDHHPIIHKGVLFWNIMMHGKSKLCHSATTYNNGFGIVENGKDYRKRLSKVTAVIAEIILNNADIEVISLCEGPIEPDDIAHFNRALFQYDWMREFETKSQPDNLIAGYPHWGLIMMTHRKLQAEIKHIESSIYQSHLDKLANRIQLWRVANHDHERYIILAHLPFGSDPLTNNKKSLSEISTRYCQLINDLLRTFENKRLVICADFNFNPFLIGDLNDRLEDKIIKNSSILISRSSSVEQQKIAVTVDGVLLSRVEKQLSYLSRSTYGLFSTLVRENILHTQVMNNYLIDQRHRSSEAQNLYDKQFGVIPYRPN